MRRLSVLALATVTALSCAAPSLEDGDKQFTMGNFRRALEIYGSMPEEKIDHHRIARTEYFLLEQGARELLHLDRPEDARTVLTYLSEMAPADRRGEIAYLLERSDRQTAQRHYELGYAFNEGNEPVLAAASLRRALSWNPEHPEAIELLGRMDSWIDTQKEIGEDYYFRGMEHLRAHEDLRARTSFMHAANLLGEDSFAEGRLVDLTLGLADESRALGRMYLEAGLNGPAWVAILDSLHLDPTNEESMALVKVIEAKIESDAKLMSVDLAVRGGATEAADRLLQEARELGVVQHASRLAQLAEDNQDQKNNHRYRRARAYELDNQMVHALALYQAIQEDEAGFGWEDIGVRIEALQGRLAQAEQAYQRALAAERDGDDAGYEAALREAVRLAVDFEDVHARYLAL
ncbi:MAG: hypothetical protein ACPG31_10300 [Planctomycetota bacterium]